MLCNKIVVLKMIVLSKIMAIAFFLTLPIENLYQRSRPLVRWTFEGWKMFP